MAKFDYNAMTPGTAHQFPPGSVIVVGPGGEFTVGKNHDSSLHLKMINCDFIGTLDISECHRALVNEVWDEGWSDTGQRMDNGG